MFIFRVASSAGMEPECNNDGGGTRWGVCNSHAYWLAIQRLHDEKPAYWLAMRQHDAKARLLVGDAASARRKD